MLLRHFSNLLRSLLLLLMPVMAIAQPKSKEVRDNAIDQISTILTEPISSVHAKRIKAFENANNVKLHFRVDDESLDHLGGLSEHLFKLWQTIVRPYNTYVRTITGEFSLLGDTALQEDLSYKTHATQDLRACKLPQEETDQMDSLYCKHLQSQQTSAVELPESLNDFFYHAADNYQTTMFRHGECPDPFNLDPQLYNEMVKKTTAARAASWSASVGSLSSLLTTNYAQLNGTFVPLATSPSLGIAISPNITPASLLQGNHFINHNKAISDCQEHDLEVRCRMLYETTGIRFLFLAATIPFYIPEDSLTIFKDEIREDLLSTYSSENVIAAVWIKMEVATEKDCGKLFVKQTGDWLSTADISFAELNNGGGYAEATLYKFLNLFKNIPKPLILCYQVAKVNGLLTTSYFSRGDKIKGREQIYYHSFQLDKAFDHIKELSGQIYSLYKSDGFSGGSVIGAGSVVMDPATVVKIDALRNEQKITYLQALKKPQFVESSKHVKEIYLQNKALVHAAGLKYLKEQYNGIYPKNQMQEGMGNIEFPSDLLAGSCVYSNQDGLFEDMLNLSSLLLAPSGLDFIPDALAVIWYASQNRTLEAFEASASLMIPGLSQGMQKTISSSAELITSIKKGDRLHPGTQGFTAVDSDLNNLCSAFGLPVEEVDQPLKKLIGDNPQTTESLLPVTAEQARIWSNTEKLEPQKRIELQYKLYQDDAFRKKCLEDPEEVLRFGGVMLDVARGVSKKDFLSSVKEFGTNTELGERAWKLFKDEDWKELEDLVNANNLNGGWPPNDGFMNITQKLNNIQIEEKIFDRFQSTKSLNGSFASPVEVNEGLSDLSFTYDSRALANKIPEGSYYIKFKLKSNLPSSLQFKYGDAIPWFGTSGKATQVKSSIKFSELIEGIHYEVIERSIFTHGKWSPAP